MKKIIIGTIAIFFTGGFLTFFVFSGVDNEDKIFALAKPLAKIKNQEKLQAGGVKLAQSKTVAILFGGDMMFDRYIRQKNDGAGYENVFGDLGKLFNGSDCVVANLEGPVTDNKSVSIGSEFGAPNNYIFTFAPSVLSMLERNNFCTVNLGNNHIGNFGKDGIMQTKNLIRSSSLHYFGDTATKGEQRFFVENVKGVKIAFV
ncbi:MAG: CapA family protein, partial [Patescibacteria group bacterium]